MKATTTNSVPFFSCTMPSSKNFNNWFSGNTTNFGSKSLSLDLNTINPEQKMFNNWFNGNTTNFGPRPKSYPLNNFYYRPV